MHSEQQSTANSFLFHLAFRNKYFFSKKQQYRFFEGMRILCVCKQNTFKNQHAIIAPRAEFQNPSSTFALHF
jgi:hypothetical protein